MPLDPRSRYERDSDEISAQKSPMVITWDLVPLAGLTMLKHQSGVTRLRHDVSWSGLTRLRHDDVWLLIQAPVMNEISPMVIRWELVAVASVTSLNRGVSIVCVMTMCASWEWSHSVVS